MAARQYVDFQSFIGTTCLGAGFLDGVGPGQQHAHAAVPLYLRLAENTDLDTILGERLLEIVEFDGVCVALDHDGARRRRVTTRDKSVKEMIPVDKAFEYIKGLKEKMFADINAKVEPYK